MDNDLGGTDGDGTSLIILQIVFAQVDPVGVTAAWVCKNMGQSCRGLNSLLNTIIS